MLKNHFAAENVANYLRGKQTCRADVVRPGNGARGNPEPLGVVVALTPSTNPTSTVIYKALMLLKVLFAL